MIIELSPKAAATLFRRCLQGMIRDFWNVSKNSLYEEITAIKDKIPLPQWEALDGLRTLGNIGAHMENDVNLIIDIDAEEAKQLRRLIEVLLENWYIARNKEKQLYANIIQIADQKRDQRKT